MITEETQTLIAQFSQYISNTNMDADDWEIILTEFGIRDHLKLPELDFLREWRLDRKHRINQTIDYLRAVCHLKSENLARSIMRRAYVYAGDMKTGELHKYPALRIFENMNSEISAIQVGYPDLFVSVENVPGTFYPTLIAHINQCYTFGVYDATLVLSRKLIENLLIDILRSRFGTDQIDLYYIEDKGRHQSLNDLIENLDGNKSEFKYYSSALDRDFINKLNYLKNTANSQAHSIDVQVTDHDMNIFQEKLNDSISVLFYIRDNLWSE